MTSTSNKSRLLRLLYRDVYCAEKLVRFGMSDNEYCRRCFGKETITHLLMECTYTSAVYNFLQLGDSSIEEVLGVDLAKDALEIRVDFICYLVFRQNTLPPEILVRTTLEKFAKGMSAKPKVEKIAKRELLRIFGNDPQ